MQSLVVFLAFAVAAHGSLLAQPPHLPAIVLDPHGRPLDTAEVINARALHLQAKVLDPAGHLGHAAIAPFAHAAIAPIAHSVVAPALVAAPAAVSHQSRVDIRTSHAAPVIAAAPLLGHGIAGLGLAGHGLAGHGLAGHGLAGLGLAGHGHLLKKRSLGHLGYGAYSAPIIAPSAVSHQSRVDLISSPAVVSHAVAAPIVSHAVAAPVVAHAIAPAAVSHQSRVDVRTSPAVIAPLAHGVVAAPLLHSSPLAYSALGHGHGHGLLHG